MVKRGRIRNLLMSATLSASMALGVSCNKPNNTNTHKPATVEKVRTEAKKKENPVDKYAILVTGSSRGERGPSLRDPIDRNLFWLTTTYSYRHLRELGFKHENIYVLYADGKPDFSEKLNGRTIKFMKRHEFNEPVARKKATVKNLRRIVKKLSKKIDGNDVFVVALNTHGNPYMVEMHNGALTPYGLTGMLKNIKPGIGLVFVDACHSGAYIKRTSLDNYVVISSTGDHTYGWGDRDYSSSRNFFENLLDPMSDTNVDGKITLGEAFFRTRVEAIGHWDRIRGYLLKKYNWDEPGDPKDNIKKVSLIPVIKVGKNASANVYLFDLGH